MRSMVSFHLQICPFVDIAQPLFENSALLSTGPAAVNRSIIDVMYILCRWSVCLGTLVNQHRICVVKRVWWTWLMHLGEARDVVFCYFKRNRIEEEAVEGYGVCMRGRGWGRVGGKNMGVKKGCFFLF